MSLQDVSHAALATSVAEIITLPICTIKSKYQNSLLSHSIPTITNIIYRQHGILGFYKASIPAITAQVVSTSSKFFLYNYLNQNSHISDNIYAKRIINGAIGGMLSSLMTHPIDVPKVYYQMQTSLMCEVKIHGPRVFYRGYSKTLGKILVGNSIIWPCNDFCKEILMQNTTLQSANHIVLLSSFTSAVITTVCCQPFDYLKIRHIYGLNWFQGWNPFLYYKGMSLNLLRNCPHFVITMYLIEVLKKQKLSFF
jgi:hypothetical protein